jgi:hypothetical protein
MNQDQQDNALSQLVAKCWADDTFKQALIADPKATLAAAGFPAPDHLTINVLENTPTHITIVIPAKPVDLSDKELEEVSAGATQGQKNKMAAHNAINMAYI